MPRQAMSGKRLSKWLGSGGGSGPFLPANPLDGQECNYAFQQTVVPADTQWLNWHLRYDQMADLWLPVGSQEPVCAQDAGSRSQAFGAGWSQYTGANLIAYVPLAGVYRFHFGQNYFYNNIVSNNWVGLYDGPSATWAGNGLFTYVPGTPANYNSSVGSWKRPGVVPAGSAWQWGVFPSAGGTVGASDRFIQIYPVQISRV